MKFVYIALVFALAASCIQESEVPNEQQQDLSENQSKYAEIIEQACGFSDEILGAKVYAFSSDIEAEEALSRIMRSTGLAANFELKAASIPNACAFVRCDEAGHCKRFIYYNQEFMERVKDQTKTSYSELAILAHEIGHHLNGHILTSDGNRHDEELEADKFAGFQLFKLGATIGEAKQAYSTVSEISTNTHPARSARLIAVSNGWYSAKRNGEKQTVNSSGTNSTNMRSTTDKEKPPRSSNATPSITIAHGKVRQSWINWVYGYWEQYDGSGATDASEGLDLIDGPSMNKLQMIKLLFNGQPTPYNTHKWKVEISSTKFGANFHYRVLHYVYLVTDDGEKAYFKTYAYFDKDQNLQAFKRE